MLSFLLIITKVFFIVSKRTETGVLRFPRKTYAKKSHIAACFLLEFIFHPISEMRVTVRSSFQMKGQNNFTLRHTKTDDPHHTARGNITCLTPTHYRHSKQNTLKVRDKKNKETKVVSLYKLRKFTVFFFFFFLLINHFTLIHRPGHHSLTAWATDHLHTSRTSTHATHTLTHPTCTHTLHSRLLFHPRLNLHQHRLFFHAKICWAPLCLKIFRGASSLRDLSETDWVCNLFHREKVEKRTNKFQNIEAPTQHYNPIFLDFLC